MQTLEFLNNSAVTLETCCTKDTSGIYLTNDSRLVPSMPAEIVNNEKFSR